MRLCLTVAYLGTRYAGWQVQPGRPTVQGTLEEAAARIAGGPVRVTGASRTDAGVHAAGQVCHLDPPRPLAPEAWQRALNALLPADIRVLRAEAVAPHFHARHDAVRRTYCYHLDPAPLASPFLAAVAWHRPDLRDLGALREAAGRLVGPVDQRPFAARPDARRPVRPVEACTVEAGRLVRVTLSGRSFLRHAVRGMVGALVSVAEGRCSPAELDEMLRSGRRPAALLKAPPHGLWLARVEYGAPARAPGPVVE